MPEEIRLPTVAGTFYPALPGLLAEQLHVLLDSSSAGDDLALSSSIGLIAPHAGYMYSGAVAAMGYQAAAAFGRPDLVVILGADHTGRPPRIAVSAHQAWETPLGQLAVDEAGRSQLTASGIPSAHDPFVGEHSIEVQLPFTQHLWGNDTPILPVCVGVATQDHLQEAASALSVALSTRSALVIASSDFTHYRPADVARDLDSRALAHIARLDVPGLLQLGRDEQLSICGLGAISLLMMMAAPLDWTDSQVVSYATSADVTGDLTSVVGYSSVLITKEPHD